MLRDRRHFHAIGQAFAADEAQRIADAAQLTPEQRILLGLEMGALSNEERDCDTEWRKSSVIKAKLHTRWRDLQRAHAKKPR